MASPLRIHAALSSGFTEYLFGWTLRTVDQEANVDAHWCDGGPVDRTFNFLIEPDSFRPLVGPFRKLNRSYDARVDDIGSRWVKVTVDAEEFSCSISGYGPEDFPELQAFEDLWSALCRLVNRELKGKVPPQVLAEGEASC